MNAEQIFLAGLHKAFETSVQIEAELTGAKSEPLLLVVHKAKEDAVDALAELATVDAEDAASIRALQNRVQRFGKMLEWLRDAYRAGVEAEQALNDRQAQEVQEMVLSPEDHEKLGLPTQSAHDDD